MKVVGLRIEKYIGEAVSGHNCDFEYNDVVMEKHIICAKDENNKKYEIVLSEDQGVCGSGWTTASWGHIELNEVERFNGFTHKPVKPLEIPAINDEKDYIDNDVFHLSYDGGDGYYPSGYYSVDMSLFKEGIRHKEKRPVWVFSGDSNTGKSFLSGKLNDLTVYETDSSEQLPDEIHADVIVLGQKYDFTVNDVGERIIGEHELIPVYFNPVII